MEKICRRCYVSGRVQGVFYRANTVKQAELLNVTGWVRNLADGRVEVLACGLQNNVEQLIEWLWRGPELAQVSEVECKEEDFVEFQNFFVK